MIRKSIGPALFTALIAFAPLSSLRADVASSAATPLTDAQIARIVRTANDGEIKQAQLAAKRSKNPKVRSFAAMMIRQHEQVNHDLAQVTKAEGIQPQDSSDAATLKQGAADTYSTLLPLQGAEFDSAYANAQVKAHQDVLNSLDSSLLPNAKDAQLQAELRKIKPAVETHLEHAKHLQASLSESATPPTG